MGTLLLTPLFRDPERLRDRLLADAARVAAGVLDAGAAGGRLARAGVDAAVALGRPHTQPGVPIEPPPPPPSERSPHDVTELVYELLDAHDDTAQMATAMAWDPAWREHLEYLRALQRKGRETLASAYLRSAV